MTEPKTIYKTRAIAIAETEDRPAHQLYYEVAAMEEANGETRYFVAKTRDYDSVPEGFDPLDSEAGETTAMITGTDEARVKEIADILMKDVMKKELFGKKK